MTQSGRIPDTHAEAWALLPFFVNGRIAPEDREWVEQHVQSCAECKRELEQQRPLAREMQSSDLPPGFSEQRAFAKLWTRIEASEGAMPGSAPRTASVGSRRTVRWLAAAVFVQAIGLALLGMSVLNSSETTANEFRTVTSAETQIAVPAVRLVFTSDTSVAQVTDILSTHNLQLVAGPHGAGVFTAALGEASSSRSAQSIAESLRRNSRVEFAEPVEP